jgi:hypothetical protein
MILFFKKIRMNLLKNNRIGKYLAYATGEIVLVVLGILIALQINNWNQNKLDQASLDDYLTSISRNIESDIAELTTLREKRSNMAARVPYLFEIIVGKKYLSYEDIWLLSSTTIKLFEQDYFIPDQSGYESLKNSGYLNKLRGEDLEFLIYQYYNLILEINMKEIEYNDSLKNAKKSFQDANFEKDFLFYQPELIDFENELDNIQAIIRNIAEHRTTLRILFESNTVAPLLVARYDNLQLIGEQIVSLINRNLKSLDSSKKDALVGFYDFNGAEGYPIIMRKGSPNNAFFSTGFAQAGSSSKWDFSELNALSFHFKNMDWGVQYFTVASEAFSEKPSKDYSSFKTLRVEAKAPISGQELKIILKDAQDPDDGTETRVTITLSDEWQTYDIALSEFETADLTQLHMVVGFVFLENEQEVQIRTVEYIR